jgi:integrase
LPKRKAKELMCNHHMTKAVIHISEAEAANDFAARKGRRVGLHAFRHALASMLLQTTGAAVAQRQLRRADASTTQGIYEHVLGNDQRDAMGEIESVLSRS